MYPLARGPVSRVVKEAPALLFFINLVRDLCWLSRCTVLAQEGAGRLIRGKPEQCGWVGAFVCTCTVVRGLQVQLPHAAACNTAPSRPTQISTGYQHPVQCVCNTLLTT